MQGFQGRVTLTFSEGLWGPGSIISVVAWDPGGAGSQEPFYQDYKRLRGTFRV